MRRGVLLLILGWMASAAPVMAQEFEGRAEVPIVGGNLVSARRRALDAARQEAIAAAATALVGAERFAAVANRLQSTIFQRLASYVQSYRVLEEGAEGAIFRLHVAIQADTRRLQHDLEGEMGGQAAPRDQSCVHPRIGIGLQVHDTAQQVSAAALSQRLNARLAAAGLTPVPLVGAARSGFAAILAARVEVEAADGVRGLDWEGARARATLRATRGSDGALLAEQDFEDVGMGTTPGEAHRMAAERALEGNWALLAANLAGQIPLTACEEGQRFVRISKLTSFAQVESVRSVLAEKLPGVQRSEPRRFLAGEVWFMVWTDVGIALRDVAQALERQRFESFGLKLQQVEGGSAWLVAVPRL